ncbi:uncharacterized protein LOC121376858 [Gigantopelta aegis]|uniref:uncharacterized protein LOC121376858 n=1 Tax=Gigantopelta aegis TaxID=1735272 RepID=UPI001B88DDA9|nr:uncharacterized protein LOC121376858 [Gigantopelta aegis]
MKYTLLLILLVAITLTPQADGGWIRWRWRKAADIATTAAAVSVIVGKRGLSEFDTNKDGHVDESELEDLFNTQEVRDIIERADGKDGNKISLKEFQQFMER